jgi:hypothetical protein
MPFRPIGGHPTARVNPRRPCRSWPEIRASGLLQCEKGLIENQAAARIRRVWWRGSESVPLAGRRQPRFVVIPLPDSRGEEVVRNHGSLGAAPAWCLLSGSGSAVRSEGGTAMGREGESGSADCPPPCRGHPAPVTSLAHHPCKRTPRIRTSERSRGRPDLDRTADPRRRYSASKLSRSSGRVYMATWPSGVSGHCSRGRSQ